MFDAMRDMFMQSLLVLGICFALIIRLAMKNPKTSGGIARGISACSSASEISGHGSQPFRFLPRT